MTITETTEAPARKKTKKKAKKKIAAAPRPKADERFAGMTVRDCCAGCNKTVCLISGKDYCAHPRKGPLHPPEMNDSAALARRKDAEKRLRDQLLRVE